MTRKNSFLLFLSACIPGCGQMYQGYMKRGVSLMSLFALVVGLATWLYFGQLALALPVIWLYSFFDTYNLRRALENDEAEPDAYPLGLSGMDQEQLSGLLAKRHVLLGWVLVLLGLSQVWSLAVSYFTDLLSYLFNTNLHWLPGLDIPRLAVFLLMIILGVRFIRGPKRRKDDGFPGFTPSEDTVSSEAEPAPSDESAAPSGEASEEAPEYRAVSDAVSRILHDGEADGQESGACGGESDENDRKEGPRYDGE